VPLRPLSIGEVLEGAWSTFRRHWQVLLAVSSLAALVTGAAALPSVWLADDALAPLLSLDPATTTDAQVLDTVRESLSSLGLALAAALVTVPVTFVALALVLAVATVVTGRAVLGRPAPWSEVWAQVRPRIGAVLGTTGLVMLAVGGLYVVAAGVVVLLTTAFGFAGLAVGVLLALPVVLLWTFLLVRWLVAFPATVLERARPVTALRRSWLLVGGQWWRTFGLLVLLALINGGVSSIVSTPLSMVAQVGSTPFDTSGTVDPGLLLPLMLVSVLASMVTNALVYPFMAAAVALRYLDLRMRKEGLADQLVAAADEITS
jgi:Membrane domain of glycerophosphoryl diester phosphodiesterase